jgi:predicted small secreted protein
MQRTIAAPLMGFALIAAALSLGACNTMRGAGQDVEAAGGAVAREANETQREMNDGNPRTPPTNP